MNKIKISFGSLFEVGQGAIVALTPEQVAPRRHRLEDVSEGVYRVRDNVQFKGGEEIGIEGDVAKGQAHLVSSIEPDEFGGELEWTGESPTLSKIASDIESTTPKRSHARGGKR